LGTELGSEAARLEQLRDETAQVLKETDLLHPGDVDITLSDFGSSLRGALGSFLIGVGGCARVQSGINQTLGEVDGGALLGRSALAVFLAILGNVHAVLGRSSLGRPGALQSTASIAPTVIVVVGSAQSGWRGRA
jgi:hypothetical protein